MKKDVNALFEAVNKVGRAVEAQAAMELQALAVYDYSLYKCIKEEHGEEKATGSSLCCSNFYRS